MTNNTSLNMCEAIFKNSNNQRNCIKGELISYQNEEAKFAYLILSGKVITRANTKAKGKALIDRELNIGSSIGLFDIILEQNYTRSAIAKTKTKLAVINYNIVIEYLNYNNIKSKSLIKALALEINRSSPGVWS